MLSLSSILQGRGENAGLEITKFEALILAGPLLIWMRRVQSI